MSKRTPPPNDASGLFWAWTFEKTSLRSTPLTVSSNFGLTCAMPKPAPAKTWIEPPGVMYRTLPMKYVAGRIAFA
jgi:hypothetical protein